MTNSFDELTGVSPLWFSVEKDEGAGGEGHSLGNGRGYEMFGDWRVEESLVDVFEDQTQARSHKQVSLNTHMVPLFRSESYRDKQSRQQLVFPRALPGT